MELDEKFSVVQVQTQDTGGMINTYLGNVL